MKNALLITHFLGWAMLVSTGPAATPFLRDVTTGYLLNCFFMSPRPYCWPAADYLLSGWEVDRSGGKIDFAPAGFAFHSEWFKLVDTSSNAAVTLKHPIARQTQGRLTWEFRFKLPARMDGACWQLRDLDRAAVSLVTAEGSLCLESGGGRPLVLAPLENGREYGVKAIVDLGTKQVDVCVDGDWKAQAVPFLNPVNTIDSVLVRTGDTPTGELFLNPVNVFKGYAANDTFVTGASGKLPVEWTSAPHGAAAVEAFECGTKPDIFSLKAVATAELGTAVWRTFVPIPAKTVVEYRFLLPEKRDGVAAKLYGDEPGLRLVTTGGDLCVIDKQSQPVPVARRYRRNLWYQLKLIADPCAGTADV